METKLRYNPPARSIFKLSLIASLSGFLAMPAALCASPSFTVNVDSFRSVAGYDPLPGSLDGRVAPMAGRDAAHEATHVLLRGLMPAASADGVYVSRYRAIHRDSQSERDSGVLYLTQPQWDLPANAAAAPVVGVMARPGGWQSHRSGNTPWTTIGGSSGPASYDGAEGNINLALQRGGESFSGTVRYSVIDTETLSLRPFALRGAGVTHHFRESVLIREGGRFFGLLESDDLGVGYDSLYFALEFTDFPDVDGDGIPDIVDPDFDPTQPGLDLRVGELAWDYRTGYITAVSDSWAWSDAMGWVYYRAFPWLYQIDLGWMAYLTYGEKSGPANLRWVYYQEDGFYLSFYFMPGLFFHFDNGSGLSGWDHVEGLMRTFPRFAGE